jgi:hypothetical protein
MATMYTLKDRQSLVFGDEHRVVNATGHQVKLLVVHGPLHCRVDKEPYPGPGGRPLRDVSRGMHRGNA